MAKRELGQFFTTSDYWIFPQVEKFLRSCKKTKVLDPFAGDGDLLKQVKKFGFETFGLDIDESLGWRKNDSILSVPLFDDTLVVTNPPYLYVSRAGKDKKQYFTHGFVDLYMEGLYTILNVYDCCVAIVPGSFFVNYDKFPFYKRLCSISYCNKNLFSETSCPVCVLCFNEKEKSDEEIECYIDDEFVCSLKDLKTEDYSYSGRIKIKSNYGSLGVKLIDNMHFCMADDIFPYLIMTKAQNRRAYMNFDIDERLPSSSIWNDKEKFITECNRRLLELRKNTRDLALLPFKSYDRHRLSSNQAKGIIENVLLEERSRMSEDIFR